jgi:taurine dioxygenase
MRVEQLTYSIGAELVGVNLADAIHDDGLFAEIRTLMLKHRVLFLRDQEFSRAEHVAFARRFGELEDHPVAGSDPEHPGLVQIYKRPDQPMDRYENAWHSDTSWRDAPSMGAVLRCVECPPVGGDTMWANMVLAYENLPADVKAKVEGLRARHSLEASFGAAMPIDKRLALKAQYPDAEHPVVRTHPETDEKVLFVNAFTTHFSNYHTKERVRFGQDANPGAGELLRYLISQAYIPEYQVRWLWTTRRAIARWTVPGLSAKKLSNQPYFFAGHCERPASAKTRRCPCNSSTIPCTRKTWTRWLLLWRLMARSGCQKTSRKTSR